MRWFLCLFIFLVSCSWDVKKPSFLVIAVDSLPFGAVHCSESDKQKGFKTVCEEMVRFTHAYTPSILAQSSLVSLLTGKYPFQHGVWNNGAAFLSAKNKTSAELAFEKGYKTLFISGGPPIWRKSGLDQGFEIFDDNIFVDYAKYYRPVMENFRIFQDRLDFTAESPFFSFIYLSDLQFPNFPTIENDGLARETTYDGQLREIDESLESLFLYLKKNNYWKNTWIVFAGLNGISKEARGDTFSAINLYHENTNVALFIKPPQEQEHQNFSWTVDANVSLVDVGRTLFELLESEFIETTSTLFKTMSLKGSLMASKEFSLDRILLFESGWPQWRKLGRSLFAFQKENYLMLYENPPKIFNTLVDRNQIYPIDTQQNTIQVLTESAQQLLALLNEEESYKMDKNVVQKYWIAQSFFKGGSSFDDSIGELNRLFLKTKDQEVAGWLARYHLENKNWKELLDLGVKVQQSDWIYVSSRALNLSAATSNQCLSAIEMVKESENLMELREVCSDSLVIQFASWVFGKGRAQTNQAKDVFLKSFRIFKSDLDIQKLNMQNGFSWDTSKEKLSQPQLIELVLNLNTFSKYKKQLDNEF